MGTVTFEYDRVLGGSSSWCLTRIPFTVARWEGSASS